jgi:hypothetical protein
VPVAGEELKAVGDVTSRLEGPSNGLTYPDNVEVPEAGPLTITRANLSKQVSARPQGDVEFTSKNGITGFLHLADDSVTITHR